MAAAEKILTTGRRKTAIARVFLSQGKGSIHVNGVDIKEFFSRETDIMIVKQPLVTLKKLTDFDLNVTVKGGGPSGQAGAIRHGLARALQRFEEKFYPEQLQAANPLQVVSNTNEAEVKGEVEAEGENKSSEDKAVKIDLASLTVNEDLPPSWKQLLKAAGYLTRDPRMVERKKVGLRKARKKKQFSKR